MDMILIGLVVVLVLANAVTIYLLLNRLNTKDDGSGEGILLMQQQLQQLRDTMDTRLSESSKQVYQSTKEQYAASQDLIREINRSVTEQIKDVVKITTEVGEGQKQVFNVAEQLQELQNILKNPKQRGVLGEYYLETVLQNVLPPGSFQMQYAFPDGEIVDAAVFVKNKVIPVDSKFSLENYNRYAQADGVEKTQFAKAFLNDLKLRITETAKYIRPSDGTTDFAFMFIPHEGIYYDLLSNPAALGAEENLIQRSAGKYKVIIVSPTSFLAYLQTVLQGLKALAIEEKAQDIIKNVEKLGTHVQKYEEYYQKLGNTLATTVNHYNAGYKELNKIDKDVTRITGESIEVDVLEIDKPTRAE